MPANSTATHGKHLALLALAAALFLGSWARLTRLGDAEFWTDELNHVFAAKSLNEGLGPLLPSGKSYTRGMMVTRVIARTEGLTGDPEFDARIPWALTGILSLGAIAFIGWRLGGPWAAVWATVLLAIYPEAIEQSRNTRFYSVQLLFGIIGLYGAWVATRLSPSTQSNEGFLERWGGVLLAATSLFVAYRAQMTTLSVVAALAVWVGGIAVLDTARAGTRAFRTSVSLQLCLLGAVAGGALVVSGVAGQLIGEWWLDARWRASWVPQSGQTRTFYLYMLNSTFSWVLAFLPASFIVVLRRAPRLALFLLTWFLIPLLLHSFVLEWKGSRYFLLPIPAVILLVSLACTEGFGALREYAEVALTPLFRERSRGLAALLIAGSGAWALVTLPAFSEIRALRTAKPASQDWSITSAILDTLPVADSLPWSSTDPLMSLYFWHRIDVGIQPPLMDYASSPLPGQPTPRFTAALTDLPHDRYSGVPLVLSPDSLRAAYGRYGGMLLGVDPVFDTFIHPELRMVLDRDAVNLCEGRCRRIQLYLWRFPPAVASAR